MTFIHHPNTTNTSIVAYVVALSVSGLNAIAEKYLQIELKHAKT